MNILEKFESDQIKELSKNKNFPVFKPGDTLKIFLKGRPCSLRRAGNSRR